VTSPETDSGKRFTQAEKRLTEIFARLAEDPRFLRVTGELLRQGSLLRIRRHGAIEAIVRALRLPPASEVDSLRDQLRRMNDQVEALSSQLELVVELLEQQGRSPAREAGSGPTGPTGRGSQVAHAEAADDKKGGE
jgi:TolA-binding protein